MHYRALLLILLLATLSIAGDAVNPDELPDAIKRQTEKYNLAVQRAEEQYKEAMVRAKKSYITDLERGVQAVTKMGDLEGATKLTELLERVKLELRTLETKAPPDAVEFGGNFYKVFHESIAWTDAAEKCNTAGGYLVCIGSQEEDDFVVELVGGETVWIGLTLNGSGRWVWADGSPVKFANWMRGQPDNRDGPNARAVIGDGRKWHDAPNETHHVSAYVCEWE